VYKQFYSSSDCGGSKTFVEGYYANYCFYTGSYYHKYHFTKGDCSDLVELFYDDSSCSSFISSTAQTNYTSCTNNDGSVPAGSSVKGFCSLGEAIPIAMDSFMNSSYADSTCSTPAVSYLLYSTGLCVDLTSNEADSKYSTCSSQYNNVTTRSYSDEGHCINTDLTSIDVDATYSCVKNGPFYGSLSCQQTAPQGTDGYLYEQYYSEGSCEGNRTYARGYYADFCYHDDTNDKYFKFYFTTESDCSDMTKRIYPDYNCLFLESQSVDSSFNECTDVTGSYHAGSSRRGYCSTGEDIPSQMAGTLHSYYDSKQCDGVIEYELFATNICVDLTKGTSSDLHSEYQTCSNSVVEIGLYTSSNCSVSSYNETYSSSTYSCSLEDKDGHSRYSSKSCVDGPPQGTDGYVFTQFYDRKDCKGTKTYANGYYANFCYGEGIGYFKYSFSSEDCSDLVRLQFSDSACSVLVEDEDYSSFADCSNSADSYPATASFRGFCTLNSTIPIPMDSALISYHFDSKCGTASYFELFATGVCVDLTVAGVADSQYSNCSNGIWTIQSYSDEGSCSSSDFSYSEDFHTYDCGSSNNDDYSYNNNYYYYYSSLSSKLRSNSPTTLSHASRAKKGALTLSQSYYTSLSCETSAPRGTDGYYYEQFYDQSDCRGNRTVARGFFGDYCFSSGTSYYKYRFTDGDCGDLERLLYSDYNCFFYKSSNTISDGLSCTDYEYSNPATSSSKRFCSYGRVIPSQMAGTLYSYYSDGSCDTVREYKLVATNLCLDFTYSGSDDSDSEYRTCGGTESSIVSFPNANCTTSADITVVTESTYYCDLHYSDDFTTTYGVTASTATTRALSYGSKTTTVGMDMSVGVDGSSSGDDSFYSSVSCEEGPPRGAVGYVFTQYYTADSCGGDKSFVKGLYGDHCYAKDGEYVKYFFTQDDCSDLTWRFYSDSDCSIYLRDERIDHFTECQANKDSSAYLSQSSYRGFCSLGVPFPVPMDSIVKSYSHDRDCLVKTYYELKALNLCLDCTNDTSSEPSSEYAICGNYSASVIFGYNITVQSYSDTSVCDPYGLTKVDISEAYACMELLHSPLPRTHDYSSGSGLFDNDLISKVWSSQSTAEEGYDTNGVYASHYCALGTPTGTAGYMYEQFYDAVNCTGYKDYAEGYYGDYCYNEGTYFYKYQFSSSDCRDLKLLLYSDSNCLRFTSYEYMPGYTQCSNTIGSYPAAASFQGFCSLESDVPIPMDGFMNSTFANGDCDTTVMYYIKATDLCVDLTMNDLPYSEYATCNGSDSSSSIKITQFNDSSCSSRVGNYSMEARYCKVTSTNDDNGLTDGLSSSSPCSSIDNQLRQPVGDLTSMRDHLLTGGLQGNSKHLSEYTSLYCVKEVRQGSDGFVYYQYFPSTDCGGSISVVDGYYADFCSPDDSGLFYKYSFSKSDCSDLVLLSYSDSECLLLTNTTKMHLKSTCQNIDDPSYSAASSFQLVCSSGSAGIPVPMDSVIESLYDSDDCSVPYQYTLTATDSCLDLSDADTAMSQYNSCEGAGTYSEYNVTAKIFDTDDCTESALNRIDTYSSTVCDKKPREQDDDRVLPIAEMYSSASGHWLERITKDRLQQERKRSPSTAGIAGSSSSSYRYSNYCLLANRAPSSAPTSSPSYGYGSPTPSPTKFKGVKFAATQVLKGISLSEYQQSQSAYEVILIKAIANSMKSSLITSSNIVDFQASGSRRLYDGSDIYILIRRRMATSSSITLTYTVFTQSSSLTYDGLSSQLKTSMSSGYFTKQLQSLASGEGYNTLAQCSSNSVSTVNETPTTDDSTSNDDYSSLSDGARAGIVIGSLIGGVLLGIGIYYYTQLVSKDSSATTTSISADEKGESINEIQDTQNPLASARSSAARSDVYLGRISEVASIEPIYGTSEQLSAYRMSAYGGPSDHSPEDRFTLADGHVDL